MSRSILLSIMFIAGTLGVIAFSAAQFTDFETDTSDPIDAGTLNLEIANVTTCTVDADGLEGDPGEADGDTQATCDFSVQHTGSLNNADLYLKIDDVTAFACTDAANGGRDDDSDYCDGGADLTSDEFDLISLVITAGGGEDYTPLTQDTLTNYIDQCGLIDSDVDSGDTVEGTYTVELFQDRTTNVMQGDAIKLVLSFELAEDQATTGAGFADCVED